MSPTLLANNKHCVLTLKMLLLRFILFLSFLSTIIHGGTPIQSEQELEVIFKDDWSLNVNTDPAIFDHQSDLERDTRNAGSASGEGGINEANCSSTYTLSLSPFTSPLSFSLDSIISTCSQQLEESFRSGQTRYNYTLTLSSSSKITTYTNHNKLFPADYFTLKQGGPSNNTHIINVTANCSSGASCDLSLHSFTLTLSLTNYTPRLLPFGVQLSDEDLTGVDDDTVTVVVNGDKPVPIFDEKYRKLYISSNGLISLTRPYLNWQAVPFPYGQTQVPVLAPFWTDFDLRTSTNNSHLYHNIYTSTDGIRARNILKIGSDRVQALTGETFTGNWALVSTWSNVVPYLGTARETSSSCTFQLVLITNYTTTYTLYLYNQTRLLSYRPSVAIGYSAGDFVTYYNKDTSSGTLELSTVVGNTGTIGQWMFKLNTKEVKEEERECLKWVRQQELISTSWISDLPSCPCSFSQAQRDWRFSFASSSRQNCTLLVTTATRHGLECCYDEGGALRVGPVSGGYYHYYHSLFYPNEHLLHDSTPFTECCVESEDSCELFYRFRPSSNCAGYVPPTPGFTWGDPHFETQDNQNYTFNGVGEYQLLLSLSNQLNTQIRLERLQGTSATVLTAIAIKSYNSQLVQLEINSLGSFVLYIGDSEHADLPQEGEFLVVTETGTYAHSELSLVDPAHSSNVYLMNINETMVISTGNGAAVFVVGKQMQFMYVGVELSSKFLDQTSGLLGYYDNEPSNDFLLRNGSVLLEEMTEQELYYNFGLEWHVSETDSIFHYHSQYTYSNYNQLTTPSFGLSSLQSNSTLFAMATDKCQEDYSCLYDVGQTGSVTVGLATHAIRNTNRKIRTELANFPPVISGSSFQVTVNVNDDSPTVIQYTAEDPDDSTDTVVTLKEPVPSGISINSTGHLTLNLTSLPSFPLYLTSSDITNTSTTQRISVQLCDCKNNGTCISQSTYPLNNNGHYRLMCTCGEGFAGLYCEEDVRGCGYDPCPTYSQCQDVSNNRYTCTDCTDGYTSNSEMKCVDVDECSSGSTNNCTQLCTNSVGGFECSCRDGYRLNDDKISCIDIDECNEDTDDCDQYCTNTDGSYTCSCESLWQRNQSACVVQSGAVSCQPPLACASILTFDHVAGCNLRITDIVATNCICEEGYRYDYVSNCQVCPAGTYGFECSKTCSCQNGGTCNPTSGCTCTTGWTGFDCGTEFNPNSPIFASDTTNSLSLPKLLPRDTPILYISATDPDTSHVTYHMIKSPHVLPPNTSDGIGIFNINKTTGLLETSRDLSSLNHTHYLLHIQARDGGHTSKNTTHLLAINLTSNLLPSPLLTSPSRTLTISENKPNGTQVYTVNCTEVNSINDQFTRLNLAIVSGNDNNTFRLSGNKLLTNRAIDYETFQYFNLVLSCTNAFNISRSTLEQIVVLNLNDNLFKFDLDVYGIEMYENVINGYEVTTVNAADADVTNATIRYSVTPNMFSGLFAVNSTTGDVSVDSTVEMPFDRETRDNYTFNINANLYSGNGDLVESTQTIINITLLDVNDFTPLFSNSLYLSSNLSQINSFPDTVLFVSAVDKDLSRNGQFHYFMQNNPHFDINPISGEVYVKTANISKGNYYLQINATDNGTTPLTGYTNIDIFVRATPEELQFNRRNYYFNFPENVGPGTTVGTVHAKLYDIFNVSIEEGSAVEAIEYRILSGLSSSAFHVTSKGHLITTEILDYENESIYFLQVSATLADFPGVTMATTKIHVSLSDVNDNAPRFEHLMYSKLIYEDERGGSEIIQVTATDRDQNGLQPIMYSLEDDFTGPFNINATNGVISLDESFSGYPQDYHFQVIASDDGDPPLTSQTSVYISIARRHTVRPVLNSTLYIFSIPESIDSNSAIGYIGAITEGNQSVPDGLGFRLKQPGYESPLIPFVIDTPTGALSISPPSYTFNYEEQEEFIFYVELYRASDDHVFDISPIVVKVTDVNDNYPIFSQSSYSTVIPLTTLPHTTILTVTATDVDHGLNSQLVYTLTSPVIGFHIDRSTGNITVTNSTLKSGDYHMTITASDKGSPIKNTSVNVSVSILPSKSPFIVFSQNEYIFEIPENSPISTFIGQVVIDSVVNQSFGVSDILFSFQTPSHPCFTINPVNGNITVSCANLNRDVQSLYGLIVIASFGGIQTAVGVQISITDINNHPPLFDRDTYASIIYTNYNESGLLLQPIVTDRDSGSNLMSTFSVVPSNNLININSQTGQVFLLNDAFVNGTLPQGDYKFILTVANSDDSSLNDTATFLLTIVELAPKILSFSQSSLIFTVPENSPGGTLIGRIQLETPQLIDPADYIGNLHFEILGGNNPDYFHISDTNTSLYLLNDLLDREEADSMILHVQASFVDYHVSTDAYITIRISDENDNAPQFNQTIYVSSLDSDVPINTYIITAHATDDDINQNALVTYTLSNSTTYFGIDGNTGVVSTLTTPIPEAHYKLIVTAVDSGTPQFTSTSVISVNVEIPLPDSISFKESSYTFDVTENSPIGTQLGTVGISQESVALNELIYSFVTPSDSNLASHLNNFHLDPISGNITTLASIDREVFSGGVVTIKAHLPSLPSLSATVPVTLNINDLNDNRPVFSHSIYTGYITEGSINTNDIILSVSASDDDFGSNGNIIFSISSSNFNIGSSTGSVKANSESLTSGIYSTTVSAKDGGSPSLTSTVQVIITVYAPVPSGINFTKGNFLQYKDEDTPVGSICNRVILKTINLTYVTSIQYTLESNDAFTIISDNLQADVRNIANLDYETTPRYDLNVTATVHLTGANVAMVTATANITVRLRDVNDNYPIFSNIPAIGYYTSSINENTANGTFIRKMIVSDADSGVNDDITFSLENNFGNRFQIDSQGNLNTSSTNIDRENHTQFLIIVIATDGGTPPLLSTAHVRVDINDVNDNPPVLVSNNNFYYQFNEEQKPSTVLFTAHANDLDSSATLSYSIVGGTGENKFTINENNGQVRSIEQLDSDDGPDHYTLDIQVSDGTNVASAIFNIHLTNVLHDSRPVFIDFPTSLRISPYIAAGTNITIIRASDADGNDLSFSLTNYGDLFNINPKTGLIQRSSQARLNPGGELKIGVRVTDDSQYTLSTSSQFTLIILEDLNFTKDRYTFNVSETVILDSVIGTLLISNYTLSPIFTIVDNNNKNGGSFNLLAQSPGGVNITTGSMFDYEDPEQRFFTLLVQGQFDDTITPLAPVFINIIDANDNSPSFIGSDSFTVSESDIMIGRVNATDRDSGTNSIISYSIDSTNLFTINPTTGVITRATLLTAGVERVTVTAVDSGVPPRNTTRVYTVHISELSAGSSIVPYVLVVIVTVICIILIAVVCILSVLMTRKRRERVKKKDRDPYLDKDINDNWKLSASRNDWKGNNFEMKGKDLSDANDTAYDTMYGDQHSLDLDQMPWANPGYRDKEFNETDLPTDDGSSDFTASISTDLRNSSEQAIIPPERRLSRAGSQKDGLGGVGGVGGVGPISRRGRRASGDESNSDLDTEDYLGQYQDSNVLLAGERPPEYDIFLKPDPHKPPPGTRPSLRNALWPHGPNQVNLPLPKGTSNTQL